jgi:GH24 family phage-related lysozyme (muramidase)
MWPVRRESRTVTCLACGESLARTAAREYDKQGNRWDREGKRFEYLCKPCYGDLTRADRAGLESLLVAVGAGECDRETFLARYCAAVEEQG